MAQISDYEAIVKVLNLYVLGCNEGKSEIMKPAFAEGAVMYGTDKDGSTVGGSIENLFKGIDASGKTNAKAHIDVLHVSGTIAIARVIMEGWHGLTFTDLHQLFKSNGEWKIIAKAYYTH